MDSTCCGSLSEDIGDAIWSGPMTSARRSGVERFTNGQSIGIGSLPHRDAAAAAAFSIAEFEIATIPALPMRSPAEGMIAQAIAGLPGVSLGQYGSFAIDPVGLTDDTPIETDLTTDAFAGLRCVPRPRPQGRRRRQPGQVAVRRPGHARRRAASAPGSAMPRPSRSPPMPCGTTSRRSARPSPRRCRTARS